MNVVFYYNNTPPRKECEVMIKTFAEAVAKIIQLPETVEVCLYPLANNVYGGIDRVKMNRIGLNYSLPLDAIPKILTHELIHVHQKFKGFLRIDASNKCYWHGIFQTDKLPEDMTHEEYQNLPWERDAYLKQSDVFSRALAFLQQ